jgi:hypothetical protein
LRFSDVRVTPFFRQVLACYLTWCGECSSVLEALHVVATQRGDKVDRLTIPSQRR